MRRVLPSPIYGSRIWAPMPSPNASLTHSTYAAKESFLGITWSDKVPNLDILRHCSMACLQATHKWHRLCWLSPWLNVCSVWTLTTYPQQTLYGGCANARCSRGDPRLSFTYACQCDLKLFEMDDKWEMTALRH